MSTQATRVRIALGLERESAAEMARCIRAAIDHVCRTDAGASAMHDVADAIEAGLETGDKDIAHVQTGDE